jgi:hypothetical protein
LRKLNNKSGKGKTGFTGRIPTTAHADSSTGYFFFDEPKNEDEDSGIITAIGEYINANADGVYIATPKDEMDYSYFGQAGKVMPDKYPASDAYKIDCYEEFTQYKDIAPLLGFLDTNNQFVTTNIDTAGVNDEIRDALEEADYSGNRNTIREVWFYQGHEPDNTDIDLFTNENKQRFQLVVQECQ